MPYRRRYTNTRRVVPPQYVVESMFPRSLKKRKIAKRRPGATSSVYLTFSDPQKQKAFDECYNQVKQLITTIQFDGKNTTQIIEIVVEIIKKAIVFVDVYNLKDGGSDKKEIVLEIISRVLQDAPIPAEYNAILQLIPYSMLIDSIVDGLPINKTCFMNCLSSLKCKK